jgi:hypothetical protein
MLEWKYSYTFLVLGTWWRWALNFTPRPHYSRGKIPVTHWTGSWVGPRAGLGAVDMRKISCPCRKTNPGCPARSPSLYLLSYHKMYQNFKYKIIMKINMIQPQANVFRDIQCQKQIFQNYAWIGESPVRSMMCSINDQSTMVHCTYCDVHHWNTHNVT